MKYIIELRRIFDELLDIQMRIIYSIPSTCSPFLRSIATMAMKSRSLASALDEYTLKTCFRALSAAQALSLLLQISLLQRLFRLQSMHRH